MLSSSCCPPLRLGNLVRQRCAKTAIGVIGPLNEKTHHSQQLDGYQDELQRLEDLRNELHERNLLLLRDNKLLKSKVDKYPRKMYQVAVLKDRLLKENAVLHYNLGVFYTQKQDYNNALVEFEKVLELNPNDPATHYNLGVIYAEFLNNKPKAMMHFKRYLASAPKDKDAERAKKYLLTWEKWE